IVHVVQILICPVFLSRYFSRNREPEPRSLMDDLLPAWPRPPVRRSGHGPPCIRWRSGFRAGEPCVGCVTTLGASCSSSVEIPLLSGDQRGKHRENSSPSTRHPVQVAGEASLAKA